MAGELADRPVVSAWRYFRDLDQTAANIAKSTVQFHKQYDWDYIKVTPRASYHAEAWGNRFDFSRWDGGAPGILSWVLQSAHDLYEVESLAPNSGPLGEQLEVLSLIRQQVGSDEPILQTVFSPLVVLGFLAGHRTLAGHHPAIRSSNPLPSMFLDNPKGVHHALKNIAKTLAAYARVALASGADGIFYATLGLARDGYLNPTELAEFAKPYDLMILESLSESPVVLHTCGPQAHPEFFADYPVNAIHWSDRSPGNPSLVQSREWIGSKAVMGGVDETLFSTDSHERIAVQASEALRLMNNRPFFLAPGCGLSPTVADLSLRALRQAVE